MPDTPYAPVLVAGEHLSCRTTTSTSGWFSMVHRLDGNLVVQQNVDRRVVWEAGTRLHDGLDDRRRDITGLQAGRLELSADGDLVVKDAEQVVRWSSDTAGWGAVDLVLHDWGQLVLRDEQGHRVWETPRPNKAWLGWQDNPCDGRELRRGQVLRDGSLTSPDGRWSFVVDGAVGGYVVDADGAVIWVAYREEDGEGLRLREDGGVGGVSAAGILRWGSPLGIRATGDALRVTDDGRLVLATDAGEELWSSPPPQVLKRRARDRTRAAQRRKDLLAALAVRGAPLREAESTPLVRTAFGDDDAWQSVLALATAEYRWVDVGSIEVTVVDDAEFAGATARELADLDGGAHQLVLAVDRTALEDPEHPVLVIDSAEDSRARSFRAVPARLLEVWGQIEQLANADFDDYARQVDGDGVLR